MWGSEQRSNVKSPIAVELPACSAGIHLVYNGLLRTHKSLDASQNHVEVVVVVAVVH